jgi:hypothetical protein
MADEPITPETPESPETPEVIETPDTPETPEKPETPEGDQPETPEKPEEDKPINPDDFTPEERAAAAKSAIDDDKDDDIDPEDKARINRQIDKRLTPLQETIQKQNDEIEVNGYLQANPEYSKYKPVIMKYVGHQAYRNIPIKNIVAIVAANDMQKIGAQKERAAQKKVAETKGGGSQQRKPAGGAVDWSKASPAEVEAQIAKVKGQA